MVLVGGMVAADIAHQQSDPADVDDEELQGDLLDVFASVFDITFVVPFILVIAAILAAGGVMTRL